MFKWINKAQLRAAENQILSRDDKNRYLLAQYFSQLNELVGMSEINDELIIKYTERGFDEK